METTDLELRGSELLNSTGGDFSKATPDVQAAAEVFFRSIDSFSSKAKAANSKKEKDYWNNQLEISIKANPHLVPFYDSWKTMQDINKMNEVIK